MLYRHDLIIGIDPGTKGGIAWHNTTSHTAFNKFGTQKMDDVPLGEITNILKGLLGPDGNPVCDPICYLENPKGIPFVGHLPPELAMKRLAMMASRYAKLQRRVGHIEGILAGLGIPYELVSPMKWMKKLDCETGGDKKITREKAWRLYPHLKPTHATADAILIMHYGTVLSYERPVKASKQPRPV